MNLIPWKGHERNPLVSFQSEMNRLFEDFFSGDRSLLRRIWGNGHEGFLPAIDVRETNDKFVVEAELPGVDPKDVEIKIEGDTLWITGERKQESEEKTKGYHRLERSYGRFERQLSLPSGVNREKVEASYKNGVLTVELLKKEEARPRTVQVKVKE